MQYDGIKKTIFEWWDNIPYELKIQKETESYDKIMEVHPKYPYIWYKLGLAYDSIDISKRLKNIFIEWRLQKDKIIQLMNLR